jgi:hypothetical protein
VGRLCLLVVLLVSLVRCTSEACRDEASSVEVVITGDFNAAVSVAIVVEYDEVTRTVPINFEGTSLPPQRIGLIPAPTPGTELRVTVDAFSRVDARGTRVAHGEMSSTLTPDGCNVAQVRLESLDVVVRDGGVVEAPRDGGVEEVRDGGDGDGDAGVRDAGMDPRDAGEEPPVLSCVTGITRDTTLLYDFDGLPMLEDLTQQTKVRWLANPDGVQPQSHESIPDCGTALDLGGYGVAMIAAADGLAIASLDFLLHMHEQGPDEMQGIVSRDATGQAEPGHFTLFRSCDDHLVLRVQDTVNSVYLCTDAPVPAESWAHVRIVVSPEPQLYVDGALQTQQTEQVGLYGASCTEPVSCGGTLQLDAFGNSLPLVVGASAHEVAAGSEAQFTRPFYGAIDHLNARSR